MTAAIRWTTPETFKCDWCQKEHAGHVAWGPPTLPAGWSCGSGYGVTLYACCDEHRSELQRKYSGGNE